MVSLMSGEWVVWVRGWGGWEILCLERRGEDAVVEVWSERGSGCEIRYALHLGREHPKPAWDFCHREVV